MLAGVGVCERIRIFVGIQLRRVTAEKSAGFTLLHNVCFKLTFAACRLSFLSAACYAGCVCGMPLVVFECYLLFGN